LSNSLTKWFFFLWTNPEPFFLTSATRICRIIAPRTKNSLFSRGGQLFGHAKNTFFCKNSKIFYFPNFFLKYYFFFLFPKMFYCRTWSLLGDKKFKNIFFLKKIFLPFHRPIFGRQHLSQFLSFISI
jgi:hypothetical protein